MCNCRKNNKRTIDPGSAAAQLTDQQVSELVASAESIATRVQTPPAPRSGTSVGAPTAVQ